VRGGEEGGGRRGGGGRRKGGGRRGKGVRSGEKGWKVVERGITLENRR